MKPHHRRARSLTSSVVIGYWPLARTVFGSRYWATHLRQDYA